MAKFDYNRISYEDYAARLRYDPETGHFHRVSRVRGFAVGSIAGTVNPDGYILLSVNRKRIAAHRLAFLAMTGKYPTQWVDHINHNPSDNRWANLREATPSQNAHHARIRKDNVSGYKGVSWSKHHQKWYAQIMVNGKLMNLKYHNTPEEADAAVRAARAKYHNAYASHDKEAIIPLEARVATRKQRKPRESWTHTSIEGPRPTKTEHLKTNRMRHLAREGYYDEATNALLLTLSCREMKNLDIWDTLSTLGKPRIRKPYKTKK